MLLPRQAALVIRLYTLILRDSASELPVYNSVDSWMIVPEILGYNLNITHVARPQFTAVLCINCEHVWELPASYAFPFIPRCSKCCNSAPTWVDYDATFNFNSAAYSLLFIPPEVIEQVKIRIRMKLADRWLAQNCPSGLDTSPELWYDDGH